MEKAFENIYKFFDNLGDALSTAFSKVFKRGAKVFELEEKDIKAIEKILKKSLTALKENAEAVEGFLKVIDRIRAKDVPGTIEESGELVKEVGEAIEATEEVVKEVQDYTAEEQFQEQAAFDKAMNPDEEE